MLIDAHAHLDRLKPLDAIIARAQSVGVQAAFQIALV